jgi:integrase
MELFKRGEVYWVDAMVNGKRIRQSTKQRKKSAALEAALRIEKNGGVREEKCPTLGKFVKETFLPWVETCSPATRQGYIYGWKLLKEQKIGKRNLADFCVDEIRATHVALISIPLAAATHNKALRTLRRIFSIAMDLDLMIRRPKIKLKQERTRDALITPEIESRVAAGLETGRNSALQMALYLILDTGLRPIEIVHLQVADLNLEGGLIRVRVSKTRAGERVVPMTTRVREKLVEALGGRTEGWVFPSTRYRGKPIQRKALSEAWRRVCLLVGVPASVKLYCARHTFATDVMKATRNPFLTMRLMGHTKLSMTDKYQHPDFEGVGSLMDARNEVRRNGTVLCHSASVPQTEVTVN